MRIFEFKSIVILIIVPLLFFYSCDNSETIFEEDNLVTGTGFFSYNEYSPFSGKPINCYYHIPEGVDEQAPILVILPGAGREGKDLRSDLINQSDLLGFIVLSISFPDAYFPGSDVYNLANIFKDGDHPTNETLNPTDVWTFSVLNPLFEAFKKRVGNKSTTYDLFGHSAGAQLLHRYLIFQPNNKVNRVVISAAGWYNLPDATIDFPYGLKLSPAETTDMSLVFSKKVFIIVGSDDTDPNSFNLRHTNQADLQGNTRLDRAQYFYSTCYDLAKQQEASFNWEYNLVPNTGHESDKMAVFGSNILYR